MGWIPGPVFLNEPVLDGTNAPVKRKSSTATIDKPTEAPTWTYMISVPCLVTDWAKELEAATWTAIATNNKSHFRRHADEKLYMQRQKLFTEFAAFVSQ